MRLPHLSNRLLFLLRFPFFLLSIIHACLILLINLSTLLTIGLIVPHVIFLYAHLKKNVLWIVLSMILLIEMLFWQTLSICSEYETVYPVFPMYFAVEEVLNGMGSEECKAPGHLANIMILVDYGCTLCTLSLFLIHLYILDTQTGSITLSTVKTPKTFTIECTWGKNKLTQDCDGYFEDVYGMEEKKPYEGYQMDI